MSGGDVVVMLLAVSLIAFIFGGFTEMKAWHKLLVERDLAEYDPKTAEWKWKEPAP